MASASNGFEAKLIDVGNRLLHPLSSADELLPLLEVTLLLYISIYIYMWVVQPTFACGMVFLTLLC